jgi:VWFA-related protein
VRRVSPSNRTANTPSSGYDETSGIIRVTVNAVPVPVTVKDATGRLFPGLTKDNFSVYEDGVKQHITFFTSDPFPVSAAIIVDVGMPEIALRKVKETFSALIGSFSQFDELSIYTYGNTVKQQQDYLAALGDTTNRTLVRIEQVEGRGSGPAAFNPMTVGPSVNGRVFDPGQQRTAIENAPPKDAEPSRVLNDALLRAAIDLGRRERARRRVIFILSDGRESGSRASYKDVLKVLLTNNVSVYGAAVDAAAIPGYNKLSKIRLPRQGYSNILPKYASATGGEIFTEFTKEALESAYGSAMEESRSQYTLVYNSPATASTTYRKVEVRVGGYGPSLKVFARDGYYPVPQKQ